MACLLTSNKRLLKKLENLQIEVVLPIRESMITALQVTYPLVEKIESTPFQDPDLVKNKEGIDNKRVKDFELLDGVLRFRGRLCVPNVEEIKKDLVRFESTQT